MSRAIKIYAVLFVVALCVTGWSVHRWQSSFNQRFDNADAKPKKNKPRASSPYDSEYDRSGKIAAIRVTWRANPSQPQAQRKQPIFWAKGSLIAVEKDDWNSTSILYSQRNISREMLHNLIDACKELPREAGIRDNLLVTRTLRSKEQIEHHVSVEKLKVLIATHLGDRKKRPFTLQALDLFAEETQLQPIEARWPFSMISLRKLLAAKTLTIRKNSHVRRIQDILTGPSNYRHDEVVVRVFAIARVDR